MQQPPFHANHNPAMRKRGTRIALGMLGLSVVFCMRTLPRELPEWRTLLGLEGEPDDVRLMREMVRVRFGGASMLHEYERLWEQVIDESKKPYWVPMKPLPPPRYAINEMLLPYHALDQSMRAMEPARVAELRTLGCAAAVRLHRRRTGSYPSSLDALQLGETAIDPFSGKPMIYRADARRGFQLYSIGANGKDDGGRAPYGSDWRQGDITPARFSGANKPNGALTPPV